MIKVRVMDHTGDSTREFADPAAAAAFVRDQMTANGRWASAGGRLLLRPEEVTTESLSGSDEVFIQDAVVGG